MSSSLNKSKVRVEYEEIAPFAYQVEDALTSHGYRAKVCGSIRRDKATISDIDLVVQAPMIQTVSVINTFYEVYKGLRVEILTNLKPDSKKADVKADGCLLNLFRAEPEYWGAMVLFLTGNKLFNLIMRAKAKVDGYKLSQYGLFHGEEIIAGKTETQIFEVLGLKYLKPEEREFIKGDYLTNNIEA